MHVYIANRYDVTGKASVCRVIGPVLSPWTRLTALKCAPLAHAERRDSHVYCLHMHVRARAPAFARVPVKNFSTLESLHWLGNGERVSFLLGRSLRNEQFWYFGYYFIIFAPIKFGKRIDASKISFASSFLPRNERFWVLSTFVSSFGGKFGEFLGKGNNASIARDTFLLIFS